MSLEQSGLNRVRHPSSASAADPPARFVLVALLAAALMISLPAGLGPIRLNDSFWIDIVWLEQFARELQSGTLYPRWLFWSHDGLGSPVFYYYPPLAFYVGGLFALLGLSTYLALIAAFAAATFISGLGVYLWLRGQSRTPLLGALLFLITPYQLFNFYQRGAIAEFLASAILPFVLVGLRAMFEGRRAAWAFTAFAYAALIMSHLPLTLLASLFLFLPYVVSQCWRQPKLLVRAAVAFAFGIALSGLFLVPALALEPNRSGADLWSLGYLQPATWNPWSASAWSDPTYRAILLVSAVMAVPAMGLIVRERSGWAIWTLACLLAAVGVVPILWSLPILKWVQFPFRLLPVAELALVTGTALAPRKHMPWLLVFCTFGAMATFIIVAQPRPVDLPSQRISSVHPDVPENLPPGKRPYSWPSKWALDVATEHRSPRNAGAITIEPVFYFPAWQVRCNGQQVPAFPDPKSQLLAHEGHGCSRTLVRTSAERVGARLSLAALLLLVSVLSWSWLSERRRSRRPEIRLHNT